MTTNSWAMQYLQKKAKAVLRKMSIFKLHALVDFWSASQNHNILQFQQILPRTKIYVLCGILCYFNNFGLFWLILFQVEGRTLHVSLKAFVGTKRFAVWIGKSLTSFRTVVTGTLFTKEERIQELAKFACRVLTGLGFSGFGENCKAAWSGFYHSLPL